MKEEVVALHQNDTWILVPLPYQVNIVSSKLIFQTKFKKDGSLRGTELVAKGFIQVERLDYHEIFNSVVKPKTIRLTLSIVLSSYWVIRQLDVKNDFLHNTLKETVFMEQPLGFINSLFT